MCYELVYPGKMDEKEVLAGSGEGKFLRLERVPFPEMVHRCLTGEIEDAKTVAAVLKAKVQLNL